MKGITVSPSLIDRIPCRTKKKQLAVVASVCLATASLAACGSSGTSASSTSASSSSNVQSSTAPTDQTTAAASTSAVKKNLAVAFFGFSSANSFAQATWKGVQKATDEYGGTAQFFSADFSASKQTAQIQDAITQKKFNVFVVQSVSGTAVIPRVEDAIKAGISVVAEYTPIGPKTDTIQPQVPGIISVVSNPADVGKGLAGLIIQACGDKNPCKAVWLAGNPAIPVDSTTTQALVEELKTASNVDLVGTPTGGQTQQSGRAAGQEALTAHPDLDVVAGYSQAIEGVQGILKGSAAKNVKLIGSGYSRQAIDAVGAGEWFGANGIQEETDGYTATKYGLMAASGLSVPEATESSSFGPATVTAKNAASVNAQYSD